MGKTVQTIRTTQIFAALFFTSNLSRMSNNTTHDIHFAEQSSIYLQDREVDRSALFDHTMRPTVIPPESKKAQLYSSPAQFETIDKRAIEVSA